jgi:PAS domain S-box-containing protein
MAENISVESNGESHKRMMDFSRLADISPDAIYHYDIDRRQLVFYNDRIHHLMGISAEKGSIFAWKDVQQWIHPDDRTAVQGSFRGDIEAGRDRGQNVFRIVLPDGSIRWLCNLWIWTECPPGKSSGIIQGFLRDQTEIHTADSQLIQSKQKAPIGSYIVQDRVFRYVNPEFARITGYSEAELIGRQSLSIVHEDYREYVQQKAVAMLRGKQDMPYLFCARDKFGGIRWALETVTSIELGGKRGTLGYFMDITELRQAQDHLSSLGLMIGIISHSLKGCLVGVDAGIYLVESGFYRNIPARIEEGLDVFKLMIERIRRLVQDILYYSKERKPERIVTDVWQFARNVANTMETRIRAANIQFKTDLERESGRVCVDVERLRAAMINILENAMEACIDDPAPREHVIEFSASVRDSDLVFEIADNGPGIDPSDIQKVFQLFYSSKGRRGTGIGLFMTRQVIQEHGGTIHVESTPGNGSRFIVTIPLNPEKPIATDTGMPNQPGQKPEGSISMP